MRRDGGQARNEYCKPKNPNRIAETLHCSASNEIKIEFKPKWFAAERHPPYRGKVGDHDHLSEVLQALSLHLSM
jgi:hypothetical protein